MIAISDFRPDAIIIAYWRELMVIEEEAEVWPVEVLI